MIQKWLQSLLSLIAQRMPLWCEAPSEDVLPPIYLMPVSQPVNIAQLPDNIGKKFITVKSIPKQRVFVLKNVFVNRKAVVFKYFNVFVPSLTGPDALAKFRNTTYTIQQWRGERKKVDGPVALYFDWWYKNYYHWMIESLPRLLVVTQYKSDCKIFVPSPAPQFVTKTLELLGYNNTIALVNNSGMVWQCETLLLPERVYPQTSEDQLSAVFKGEPVDQTSLRFNTSKIQDDYDLENQEPLMVIRRRLLDSLPAISSLQGRRIYITRARQKTRRLVNESSLLPILQQYGFEIVDFDDFDFEGQVQLMRQTSCIMAVHGANLVNTLFLEKGTKVIELMNENYLNDVYYQLASSIGLPYYFIPCRMANDIAVKESHFTVLNNADIVGDLNFIESVLKTALQEPIPTENS